MTVQTKPGFIEKVHSLLGMPLLMALCCAPAAHAAEAFIAADPVTGKVPTADVRVMRKGIVLAGDAPLEACDVVEFVAPAGSGRRVRITHLKGGKQLVLDEQQKQARISCEPAGVSAAFARAWVVLAGVDRAEQVRSAASRGGFLLPVFDAPKSLIGAGRRALVVPWVGGKPPIRVSLSKADTDVEVCSVEVEGNSGWATLPPADLRPGQYTLTVLQDHARSGLKETNLFVVAADDVPRLPKLTEADLTAADVELLNLYFLEGQLDGRWTFEAVQQAAAIRSGNPAVADWLRGFGVTR